MMKGAGIATHLVICNKNFKGKKIFMLWAFFCRYVGRLPTHPVTANTRTSTVGPEVFRAMLTWLAEGA